MIMRLLLALAVLTLPLAACKKKKEPPPPAKPPVAKPAPAPAPAPTPAPKPAPKGPELPKWAQSLPAKAVTAKPGDMVWATIPVAKKEMPKAFGVFKVKKVAGNFADLEGSWRKVYKNVPGALLLPVGSSASLKPGDMATISKYGSPRVGVVVKNEPGKIKVKYPWVRSISESTVKHAQPLVSGIAPLAWVHYKGKGFVTSRYKGIVIAKAGNKLWVLTMSGHVMERTTAQVKPLQLARNYKVGQKIWAYYPAYVQATVKKVVKPGLMYTVELQLAGGKKVTKTYSWDDLTPAM